MKNILISDELLCNCGKKEKSKKALRDIKETLKLLRNYEDSYIKAHKNIDYVLPEIAPISKEEKKNICGKLEEIPEIIEALEDNGE